MADKDDIIDEVLMYFRANVLFRNFEVKGGADKTLIYLTLHAVQCLVKLEKIEDKNSGGKVISGPHIYELLNIFIFMILFTAVRELRALSTKQFAMPGDTGFPVGGLFPPPTSKAEAGISTSDFSIVVYLCVCKCVWFRFFTFLCWYILF